MVEGLRKITRFSLACFLWLHTLFLLNLPPELLSKLSVWLHLSAVETILFALLMVFAFVSAKGFWHGVANVAYVYFFPFVVFFYVCVGIFYALRAFARATNEPSDDAITKKGLGESGPVVLPVSSEPSQPINAREKLRKVAGVLFRPFKRFTVLWCLVLATTTHGWILWAALELVLLHLSRAAYIVLKISFFSGGWFGDFEKIVHKNVDEWVTKLHSVTRESPPSPDLKNLWTTVKAWERAIRFVQNEALVSKWALLLGSIFFGCVYVYFAFLFSFAYYGIARGIALHTLSWLDFLVTSLFIPFFVGALPQNIAIRFLAGLQCIFVLAIGIGSIQKYLRRRIRSISLIAKAIDSRLSDQILQEKKLILEEKYSPAATVSQSGQAPQQ